MASLNHSHSQAIPSGLVCYFNMIFLFQAAFTLHVHNSFDIAYSPRFVKQVKTTFSFITRQNNLARNRAEALFSFTKAFDCNAPECNILHKLHEAIAILGTTYLKNSLYPDKFQLNNNTTISYFEVGLIHAQDKCEQC